MQAVVLMAGKGTRWAKHFKGPKQLMPVADKPVVEHALDMLPAEIDELIFIVGGPHESTIRDHFKSGEYDGRPITFVVQTEQLGLAHAFKFAARHVKGRWLGMVGDDIVGPKGLQELATHDLAVLAYRVPNPQNFGVLVVDENGVLVRAVEKPQEFVSDLAWTGHMIMDERFFTLEVPPSARGEYETPDVWTKLVAEQEAKIKVVESEFWFPINDRAQFKEAEQALTSR